MFWLGSGVPCGALGAYVSWSVFWSVVRLFRSFSGPVRLPVLLWERICCRRTWQRSVAMLWPVLLGSCMLTSLWPSTSLVSTPRRGWGDQNTKAAATKAPGSYFPPRNSSTVPLAKPGRSHPTSTGPALHPGPSSFVELIHARYEPLFQRDFPRATCRWEFSGRCQLASCLTATLEDEGRAGVRSLWDLLFCHLFLSPRPLSVQREHCASVFLFWLISWAICPVGFTRSWGLWACIPRSRPGREPERGRGGLAPGSPAEARWTSTEDHLYQAIQRAHWVPF